VKKSSLIAGALVLALVGFWAYRHYTREEPPAYRFGTVERGDIEAAVSATGALSAVTTVTVGTQASGQIAEILADFNDQVKKGQLIARLDPRLQQQAVADAQAGLDRTHAQAEQAKLEYERNQRLFENKVLTEIEFNTAKYAYQVAAANVKSAQVALDRARQNLAYTSIYSPVDGVIVERNVDVGQTVTSSLSTPQLFLIAQDLSQLQILASVDESDIGQIKNGQKVRFSVQAYPNQTFDGIVSQVRLQSKTTDNVVNYTVAVAVQNASGKLLPGMTATVEFLTGFAANVLTAPNAALRFRPPQEVLDQMRAQWQERTGGTSSTSGAAAPAAAIGTEEGNRSGTGLRRRRSENAGTLWHLDEKGQLKPLRVRTGITDGQKTQVENGADLKDGMQVIVGALQAEQGQVNSLFAPGGQQQQRGPAGAPARRGF
jgi:HlyD family secretion protein